jgi:hypothetical protein
MKAMMQRGGGALLAVGVMGAALGLGGCRSSYALDVRNQTPQVLYAQVLSKNNAGTQVLGTRRLGPGDRAGLGPWTLDSREVVWAQFDTNPNPERAPELTLRPGLSVLEVTQDGTATAGPLRVREIGGAAR